MKLANQSTGRGRWIGLEQVPRMVLFQGPWWAMGNVSVPIFLKPGMFICTNTDKINIYDIHTLRNFSFTQMMMTTMKISLFTPTSDFLATINAVVFHYTVIYDD